MTKGHTTNILKQGQKFFVAELDNGGARFGMLGLMDLDVPFNHPLREKIVNLAVAVDFDAAAKSFLDSQIEAARIDIRACY